MFWLPLNTSPTLYHYDFSVLNKDHQLFVSKMSKGLNQRCVGEVALKTYFSYSFKVLQHSK